MLQLRKRIIGGVMLWFFCDTGGSFDVVRVPSKTSFEDVRKMGYNDVVCCMEEDVILKAVGSLLREGELGNLSEKILVL